jgi:hypothetical protein
MKSRTILISVVLILIFGAAAAGFFYFWPGRTQVINFDNGDKLTLLGVDYGKRHVTPGAKPSAPAANNGARNSRSFTTQNDALVVWLRLGHDPQQYPNYQFYIYDKAGTACTEGQRNYFNNNGGQQSKEVFAIQFDAFPRRAGRLAMRVQGYVQGAGQVLAQEKFKFANPVNKSFPKWTSEPLPATKEDGGLTVTLDKLSFGASSSFNRDQDNPDDAINKGVEAVYHVEQNGKPVTNWEPASIQTSDATGNHAYGGAGTRWQDKEGTTTYQWGLWPDEAAWKVRFEFSKQSGYDENELWSVKNIPIQPGLRQDFWNYNNNRRDTNTVVGETDLNGIHLKVYPAKQFTDAPPNSQPQGGLTISVKPSPPEGMRMNVTLTDDQGGNVEYWNNGTWSDGKSTTYRYGLRDITGATNLNLTIAMHQSHFFEFTVKPAVAAAAQ